VGGKTQKMEARKYTGRNENGGQKRGQRWSNFCAARFDQSPGEPGKKTVGLWGTYKLRPGG